MTETIDAGAGRVARLERELQLNRGLTLGALVLAAAALFLALGGGPRRAIHARTLDAERFVLCDSHGVVLGEWGMIHGAPQLTLGLERDGEPRIALGAHDHIALLDGHGLQTQLGPEGIEIHGAEAHTRVLAGCVTAGTPTAEFLFPDPAREKPAEPKQLQALLERAQKPGHTPSHF